MTLVVDGHNLDDTNIVTLARDANPYIANGSFTNSGILYMLYNLPRYLVPSGSVLPNVAALPIADTKIGNWTGFPGASWALNSAWTDTTGAVLRRLTNATNVGANTLSTSYAGMEYASSGPFISRPFGTNLDTYHVYLFCSGAASVGYCFDYKRGVGVVAGSLFQLPILSTDNLAAMFSMYVGDSPHIIYLQDRPVSPAPGLLHRYNCASRAYETSNVFSGTNASIQSIPNLANEAGWLQSDWSGRKVLIQSPVTDPTTLSCLDLATGTRIDYNGVGMGKTTYTFTGNVGSATSGTLTASAPVGTITVQFSSGDTRIMTVAAGGTSVSWSPALAAVNITSCYSADVNEMKVCHGNGRFVMVNGQTAGWKAFWFLDSNFMTSHISGIPGTLSGQGHSNLGESSYYVWNGDDGNMPLQELTAGSAPGSDGGAWTGANTKVYNAGNGQQTQDADNHPSMSWVQYGAGANEWYCCSYADSNGGAAYKTAATAWTVDSGNVYKTGVTFGGPQYGTPQRGVTGVITLTGTNYTGNLLPVASHAAVVPGTFWWDNANTLVYACMSANNNPTANVRLVSGGYLVEAIGYVKQDGSERRKLCFTYRNDNTYIYNQDCYANWSPDGLVVFWNCNFGVPGGRTDLVAAEVPHT